MAEEKHLLYRQYLTKTFFWVIGNAVFGLIPLIFMLTVYELGEKKIGIDEINHLIHEGVILFVSIAIMGSVFVDYALSGFKLKGIGVFAIYIFPLCIVAIISIDYLLIHLGIISNNCFSLSSKTTKFVVGLSFIYILFAKTSLYIKEDFGL